MRIFVKSRDNIEEALEKDPKIINEYNIISIYSRYCESPIKEDRYNILKLEFDDITERELQQYPERYKLFSENDARRIKDFTDSRLDPEKKLIVHCDAGISRSGAVGLCLNDYLNNYIESHYRHLAAFLRDNPYIVPNPYISRVLNKVLYYSDLKEDK